MPILEKTTSRHPLNEAGTATVPTVIWMTSAGAPSGTTGQGFAGRGSKCTRVDTGKLYVNTGTAASPTWQLVTSA